MINKLENKIKNKRIYKLYKRLLPRYYFLCNKYYKIFKDTSKIEIFNPLLLSNKICPYKNIFFENSLYGNFYNLIEEKKLKISKKINIEHTFFLPEAYEGESFINKYSTVNVDIALRMKTIKKVNKQNTLDIGPYINYSKSYYPKNKTEEIKEKMGKTLTVFPAHSIITGGSKEKIEANFSVDKLIDKIKVLVKQNDIKTVLICLYYADINIEVIKYYEEFGFKVVSAGHKFDRYFINRLKSILEITDYTMSNKLGTYIPYSLALGKPHYIYKQELEYQGKKEELEKQRGIFINTSESEIYEKFGEFKTFINNEQKEFANQLWGLNIKKDLSKILL